METLLLSFGFEPMGHISWQRAVTLYFLDKVEIIEEHPDRVIRSVSFTMRMPLVVRFVKMSKYFRRGIKFARENVYARDQGRCQYCAKKVSRKDATLDHVVPRWMGGKTTWENIVIACRPCNQKKGGRTPDQARMKLISTPKRPAAWSLGGHVRENVNAPTSGDNGLVAATRPSHGARAVPAGTPSAPAIHDGPVVR